MSPAPAWSAAADEDEDPAVGRRRSPRRGRGPVAALVTLVARHGRAFPFVRLDGGHPARRADR